MLEQFRLSDQVAIVTGAGRGIGAAIAESFGEAGADVVLTARTASQLDETSAAIGAHGGRVLAVPGDVNDLDFLAELVATTKAELGRIDIVVNNAGGSMSKPMLETRVDELEAAFHFNVSAPFELSRLAVPSMLEVGGGSIVNIGSVAGRNANRGGLTHSLTKAALAQLTRLMAAELAPRIRVNAVLPGAIETAALKWWLDSKDASARDEMRQNTPMRRNGIPEDVAPAVLFLVSPAASWVTGKLIEVDGGAVSDVLPSRLPDL
jgi:7-alpha-hydroxysteroid dehydrogenase